MNKRTLMLENLTRKMLTNNLITDVQSTYGSIKLIGLINVMLSRFAATLPSPPHVNSSIPLD